MTDIYDLVVIGAGPGGYVAAIRAAQLGMRVACVESEKALGGTCLRVGCIPSKALLESSHRFHDAKHGFSGHGIKVSGVELDLPTMMSHKDTTVKGLTEGVAFLFRKNKVDRVNGFGRITSPTTVAVRADDNERTLQTRRILIATGSTPVSLKGVTVDENRIVTSTGALSFPEVPRHLIVIGAGVIGLELGSVWSRLGAKVTVLEYMDRILAGMDAEVANAAQKLLAAQGLEFQLGRRVQGATVQGNEVVVEHANAAGEVTTTRGDRLLVSTGRRPFTDGLGLDAVGVKLDGRGRVEVDGQFQTNVKGVFAIGDVIRGPMLAHKAEDEGVAAAEIMATGHGHVNYAAIPAVVYTFPEVASVGKTEEELNAEGVPYKKGSFPFKANGRAKAQRATEGFTKILVHEKTDRILGAHIIGPQAGDLIQEIALAIEFEGSSEDVARTSHAHPSLSEVVREAALATQGRAIHN
ncbi:MAG: dihydrolipoyl dehydrogenase [Myxococcota bacterium]